MPEPREATPEPRPVPRPQIRNGNIDFRRLNLGSKPFQDLYHELLVAPWHRFIGWLWLSYMLTNLVFAALYLAGGDCYNAGENTGLWSAFAFSIQTLTTIGYGGMTPTTAWADAVVAAESFVGLFGVAVSSGLCFSKFGRPNARVAFAEPVVLTTFHGRPTLMVRVANERNSRIVDARVHMFALMEHKSPEGHTMRRFFPMTVERDHTPLFLMSWQIIHTLDADSPLVGLDQADLPGLSAIVVTITGTDAVFMQTVYSQYYYQPEDIRRGSRFADMITSVDGMIAVDHGQLHETVPEA